MEPGSYHHLMHWNVLRSYRFFSKLFQKEVFFDRIEQFVFIHQSGSSGEMKGI